MTNNSFTIYENKMLKPFATLISCRDTINSECIRGVTLDQCVENCANNPFCACGYYLEPSNSREASYCAPLNSALLKNMNLHWNIYDKDIDPTKELWKKTAVFFRPDIYPPIPPDDVLLMQRDICVLCYTPNHDNSTCYFLQDDLTWLANGESSAMLILFIDKFPQFYELANNIQDESVFVMKIFSRPQVIAIFENKLTKISYLSINPEKKIPDTYMYIQNIKTDASNVVYPVLTFNSKFQILSNEQTRFLGIQTFNNTRLELVSLPWDQKPSSFTGYFTVTRKSLQPNIFKVADILPARLVFLQNSISPMSTRNRTVIVLLVFSIILIIIMVILFFLHK